MSRFGADNAGPLISIIVPMADDAVDGAQRIASALAQTWSFKEVVAVRRQGEASVVDAVSVTGLGLGAALRAGLLASKGTHVCVMLPGSLYMPEKIKRQVEYMLRMDLQDAVLFCDHVCHRVGLMPGVVTLPSIDPAVVWQRLFAGLDLQFAGLLLPRNAFDTLVLPVQGDVGPALFSFCVDLSRRTPFVGMAQALISVLDERTWPVDSSPWREVHASVLAEYLQWSGDGRMSNSAFATLGEAANARVSAGLLMPAWDVMCAAMTRMWPVPEKLSAARALLLPFARGAFRRLPRHWRTWLRPGASPQDTGNESRLDFGAIFRGNGFVGTESLSGAGSTLFQTRIIRREIPPLLRRLRVASVLDIPCGDFHWMRELDLDGIHYTGADVVPDMVHDNTRRHGSAMRVFKTVDLIAGSLPRADLVFCRDCLVHLPFVDAMRAIESICSSGCEWLLVTTFTETHFNQELDSAGWRGLNMMLPPFDFPPPQALIDEKCTEAGGRAADKALGLWRISDLPRRS